MGNVIVEFVGLHLIDNRDAKKRTVAVINANKEGFKKRCGNEEKALDRHEASIQIIEGTIDTNWPGPPFELKGKIGFSFSPAVELDEKRGPKLLRVNHACPTFTMPDDFFSTLEDHDPQKHALVTIPGGRLKLFGFEKAKSIHLRVEFDNLQSFTIERRKDSRFITFDLSRNANVRFANTETPPGNNDDDWLWYMVATKNACCGKPNEKHVPDAKDLIVLDPGAVTICPISLGCSNSNWP